MPFPIAYPPREWIVGLSCVLSLFGGCSTEDTERRPDVDAGLICASCGGCEEQLPVTSAQHVSGAVDYPDIPPVGGPHSQCWADWGVHETEVRTERWVHNLEHGGVVLLYRCDDGCETEVQSLRDFVAAHPRTLLTPSAALPERFAAVAWERRIVSECLDLAAIARFYDARVDHGPESLSDPPPVVCAERPQL
jgi:hypothetical protein